MSSSCGEAGNHQHAAYWSKAVTHVWCLLYAGLSQEEKRKMKEEIERRRAEAAEKRQKVEDSMDGEDRPFKCVSPRGSSLKVGPFPSRRVAKGQACFVKRRRF